MNNFQANILNKLKQSKNKFYFNELSLFIYYTILQIQIISGYYV